VRIVDRVWNLDLAHSRQGMAVAATRADDFLVASGMALSLLLALLLYRSRIRQHELARNRERYRLLVENQADFIVQIDTDGFVLFVSPSMCHCLGKTEKQLVGRPFLDLVHVEDAALFLGSLQKMQEGASSDSVEFRLDTPGEPIWSAWNATTFHSDVDGQTAYVGVGRDISERRQLEQQLLQSQRLQAVGQLAGGIAHDFNNILQAIHGYLEFVMEDLPAESDARQDLEQARKASERAAVLVRQLLAFSRRQILKPVNLDLNRVVGEMLSLLGRVLGSTINLQFQPGSELGLVKADQGQLEQILMNLSVNARDAMPDGGEIHIRTSEVDLDEAFCARHQGGQAGPHVRLDFEDTGLGMSHEVQEKLFEPFFTTKESGWQGHGAGAGHGVRHRQAA
jgi:two-component system cell cycle sensor histidine kinase/response regulator CckA